MALTARKSPRYLGGATAVAVKPICSGSLDNRFELDESEIWDVDDVRRPDSPPARNTTKKPAKADYHHIRTGPRSVPVDVHDWSKILGGCQSRSAVSPESEGAGDDRLPPHEFLARTRAAPFSVTLKGSDLRRVRNAIWKKTGFED